MTVLPPAPPPPLPLPWDVPYVCCLTNSRALARPAEHLGYVCIQEILALRKLSLRPHFHVSRGEISHFKHPRVLEVNCVAIRTF